MADVLSAAGLLSTTTEQPEAAAWTGNDWKHTKQLYLHDALQSSEQLELVKRSTSAIPTLDSSWMQCLKSLRMCP